MNMRLLLCCMLSLIAFRSLAQETKTLYFDWKKKPCGADTAYSKRVGTKVNNKWHVLEYSTKSGQVLCEADYADDGFTIADGPYAWYYDYEQKKVSEKGNYKNGKKEGQWKGWYRDNSPWYSTMYVNDHIKGVSLTWRMSGGVSDSTIIDEKGSGYEKSFWQDGKASSYGGFTTWKKEGDWTYYHRNGRPSSIEKMKGDSVISLSCFDEDGNPSTQYCGKDVESEFPGGQAGWLKYVHDKTAKAHFPQEYFDGKIYGSVMVEFVVDENGDVTDVTLITHADPKLEAIALKTIQSSPKWTPAWQHNRRMKSYKRQPYVFPKYQ
jgi:TonB family protein